MAQAQQYGSHSMMTRSGNNRGPRPGDDGVVFSDTLDDTDDSVYPSDVAPPDIQLWDGHSTVSVSSRESSTEDGENGDGNNDGNPVNMWVVTYRKTKMYKRTAFRDFRPKKDEEAGAYLQSEYELSEFKTFLKKKLELTNDCAKKVYAVVKNFYNGNGYENRAWDMPFLDGMELTTLDYDFDELCGVAKLAQDRLGDSRKGYLALALNHLRRYKFYLTLKKKMKREDFEAIQNWRERLMNH